MYICHRYFQQISSLYIINAAFLYCLQISLGIALDATCKNIDKDACELRSAIEANNPVAICTVYVRAKNHEQSALFLELSRQLLSSRLVGEK